jgi:hypothetical protein
MSAAEILGERLLLAEMDTRYVGEHLPGNTVWSLGRAVQYLSSVERQSYRLRVEDGIVFDAHGRPFDTAGASTLLSGAGRAIFVMGPEGDLYASNYQRQGSFHHSTFFAGAPVAAAGELVVDNGRLILATDLSRHYAPPPEHMDQCMRVLEQGGVRVDLVERATWPAGSRTSRSSDDKLTRISS